MDKDEKWFVFTIRATGCGRTPEEALSDALETLAQEIFKGRITVAEIEYEEQK